jgi:hypothetical protein
MNEYITRLIDITIALERQQCAHHYLALMRDAVEQARTKEREKCAGDYLQDCANAIKKSVAAEQARCIAIIENYQIPVGGSSSAEIACEMIYSALKAIRDEIKGVDE